MLAHNENHERREQQKQTKCKAIVAVIPISVILVELHSRVLQKAETTTGFVIEVAVMREKRSLWPEASVTSALAPPAASHLIKVETDRPVVVYCLGRVEAPVAGAAPGTPTKLLAASPPTLVAAVVAAVVAAGLSALGRASGGAVATTG